MLALACIWLAASCSKRNEALCCATDAECTAVGFSSHQPCDLGVCVNYACTTTPGACDDDGDCASTPATPTCVANTCSACATDTTCPAPAPVCDTTSHSCRTCSADAECDSGACDLAAGTCITPATIRYAGPTASDSSECTRTTPCSLSKAATLADEGHPYIVMLPGTYTDSPLIDGKDVTICGSGATLDSLLANIVAENGASIWIRDLVILSSDLDSQGDGTVINCNNCSLTLDKINLNVGKFVHSIVGGPKITIRGSTFRNGFMPLSSSSLLELTIDQSTFWDSGGLSISGNGGGKITNSVFYSSTGDIELAIHANEPSSLGSVELINNTFSGATIYCNGSNGSSFKSSILHNIQLAQSGAHCSYYYDLAYPGIAIAGPHNLTGDPLFADIKRGDLHIVFGSPAVDAADPAYPLGQDHDGIARPQGPAPDIGAFELKK